MSPAALPPRAVERIVHHVYESCLFRIEAPGCRTHFCSPAAPCKVARDLLSPLANLKLVAVSWNAAVHAFQQTKYPRFFGDVEDGYYPHAWHINTRMRKAVLLARYRVFRTFTSEDGNRGVYVAHDFGGAGGCAAARAVVLKAWVSATDFECQREIAAYRALGACPGVPAPRIADARHDPLCDVHVLVLPKLGPTLEDLRAALPDHRFTPRMVLTVAIEMLDRYRDIHARGVVHSGIKPGNICLAPQNSADAPSALYAIDFGFSTALAANAQLPSAHRIDAVGNRRFMSVFAHHGISQSQRDDLESLAYLLSYLFHARLPWASDGKPRSPRAQQQHAPHVWRIKLATPAAVLFRDMDACFLEFWHDVKGLAYAEVPDYDRMRARFAKCLEMQDGDGKAPLNWWDLWEEKARGRK
ncbi:kinase-like domain-containing protein [Mycena belliarum]|uniref:Kinase-like domain-containing protein n=1 Tax=Mycena belliarum TaxID=1033014 RepID=A0AAD6UER7_9AGAR|nr:kinase-like domain-containing protein [Mycena belliae]